MHINGVSKIHAAKEQLKTAIDLFFHDGDPVSTHTLACASQEIIESLGKIQGLKSMKIKTLEEVGEDKRKVFFKAMNEAKNSFKHADRDPHKTTKLNTNFTELVLWDAVRLYYFITKEKVPLFIVYDLWAYSKYPELYKMKPDEEKNYKQAIGEFTYHNKDYFYDLLSEYDTSPNINIMPREKILHFAGKRFGPQVLQFDKNTKVWTSFFTLDGQELKSPDEELIFNFYLRDVWAPKVTSENVSHLLLNSFKHIIGKPFTAPDNITKRPAYCIVSHNLQPNYGFIYITKITSLGDNVFGVTYSKKIMGTHKNQRAYINYWINKDLKSSYGIAMELFNISLDESWMKYLCELKR